jgi:hypothetical protein
MIIKKIESSRNASCCVNIYQMKYFLTVTTQRLSILPFTLIVYSEFIDLDCYMFRLIKEPSSGNIH